MNSPKVVSIKAFASSRIKVELNLSSLASRKIKLTASKNLAASKNLYKP